MASGGNFFREQRRQARLSQRDVAAAVGVSQNTVSKWENDRSDPTGDHLDRLLDVLGVDRALYTARVRDDALVYAVEHIAVAMERIAAAIERRRG